MAKKDYTSWSRDELVKEIDQLRKRKKYGLVWEEKPEDILVQCKSELPVLEEVKDKEILNDPKDPTNLIIEGDNFHALSILNYTHKGKIDAIYADPPYNTGAKNWKYNNDYVDGNDAFRHSKWLSFMEKRLKLARTLLKEDGVIVITIDDYEIATLTLMMNEIFGEENRLGTVVIKNNPSGRSTTAGFAVSHEYALFYGKSSKTTIGRLQRSSNQIARYKNKDEIGNFEWVNFRARYSESSPRLQYPLFVKKDGTGFRIPSLEWDSISRKFKLLEEPGQDEFIKYPVDDHGQLRCWKWGIETVMEKMKTDTTVKLDQRKQPTVYVKARMNSEGMLPLTWWDKTEYSATAYGTNLLSKIMSSTNSFDYPKSLYAVIDCLRIISSNKNGIFLDFFAGSGTTGHAVLELNKEDGGNRKFILCTSNESNIAQEVTLIRMKNVISGYKFTGTEKNVIFEAKLNEKVLVDIDVVLDDLEKIKEANQQNYDKLEVTVEDNSLRLYGIKKSNGKKQGLGGNLKYFKTTFVPANVTDKNKVDFTQKATEMLCVKEDTFERVTSNDKFKIFRDKDRYTGIILDHDAIDDFKKAIAKIDGKFCIYIFSLGDDEFEEEFEDVKQKVKLLPIPEVILRVYRRIFV